MKEYIIVTDSASDFTKKELDELDIRLAPMTFVCGEDSFIDDRINPVSVLWNRLLAGEQVMTSQPSPDSFLSIFREAKQSGKTVICVTISSELSGAFQSASLAKQMADYEKIHIIDSKNVSAGEKFVVLKACKMRDEGGYTGEDIENALISFRNRVKVIACIDTLEFLVRGGRISKSAGMIGNILGVKPVFQIPEDGTVEIISKNRGLERGMKQLISHFGENDRDKEFSVIPLFAYDDSNCKKFLNRLVSEYECDMTDFATPVEIGITVGVHVGPGGFGFAYVIR